MIVLAVHTTTPFLAVAIVEDGRLLADRTLPPAREHLENLAPLIKAITVQSGLTLQEIDGFGVAVGPGSFSGIRVGLALVKGMAIALRTPVVGISSLEILAWGALDKGEIGASVIDARRGECYAALYERRDDIAVLLDGPMLIRTDDVLEIFAENSRKLIVCGDLSIPGLSGLKEVDQRRVAPAGAAGICAVLSEQRLRRGDADNVHMLAPQYVRRSDAEEKKKTATRVKGS